MASFIIFKYRLLKARRLSQTNIRPYTYIKKIIRKRLSKFFTELPGERISGIILDNQEAHYLKAPVELPDLFNFLSDLSQTDQ